MVNIAKLVTKLREVEDELDFQQKELFKSDTPSRTIIKQATILENIADKITEIRNEIVRAKNDRRL